MKEISDLIKVWKKRNILGFYFENREEAKKEILKNIALNQSIGISGSVTLTELKIVQELERRGNKVFNQYREGLAREESLEVRKLGAQADTYLASANAIAQSGEIVFFSAYGNRISGIASASNVIIVCGKNKIAFDFEQAIKRARETATTKNSKRLNWHTPCLESGLCKKDICLAPDYKRMCCQILVIEADIFVNRIKVFIINEDLGF